MKRIAKLLLLAAFAALLAPTAQAAKYELAIAGLQVTDANKDDILGDGGSVRFSLTGTNGTLTLSNAAITNVLGDYRTPFVNFLSGIVAVDAFALTIVLEGSNVVKAVPNTGIYATWPLTITGGGSLSLVPNEDLGIVAKGDLTIDGVTVSAEGSSGGCIECAGNLTITNADVTANSRSSGNGIECQRLSIGGASRLEAITAGTGDVVGKKSALWFENGIEIGDGLVVLEPSPYWIADNTIHAEGDSGRDGALRVVIGPPVAYPLWVGSTQVTSANAANILGDGTARFESSASGGTLYLSNARITEAAAHPGSDSANIWSDSDFDLTISLTGSNRVENAESANNNDCVWARGNLAITGSGTLVVENTGDFGIGTRGSLRIDGATVTVSAGDMGLSFGNMLAISNATVTATGTSGYGIYCSGTNGRIDIADSVVTATGGTQGLYARGTGSSLAVSGASVVTAVTTSDDDVAFSAAALVLGDGLAVTEPAGGVFGEDGWGSGCVIDPATGKAALRVVIGPAEVRPETTSVRIVKVWDDGSDRAGRRPSSVSFTLAGGSFETNVVLDCSGGADRVETTVSGVPRYAGGSEIAYSLVEDPVPGDYRAVVVDEGKVVPETAVEPGVSLSLTVNGAQNARVGEGETLNFLAMLSGAEPGGSVEWSWDSENDTHTAQTDLSGAGEATLARTYEELKTLVTAGEEHVMTATYRTNGVEAARARVPFGLLGENPAVVFVEPALDGTFYVDEGIGFKVRRYKGRNSQSLTLKWQCASTQLSDGYSAPANGTTETMLAFREAGDHRVTVTVTDQDNKTGSETIVVHVVEPPEPIQSFSVTNSYAPPPVVSNVVARQRWPWNGLVDVDYEVGGDEAALVGLTARISFAADDGRSWTASNFLAGVEPSADPGPHRATWDTNAAGVTNVVAAEVTAKVELVREE